FQTAFRVQPGQRAFAPARRPTLVLASRHRDHAAVVAEIEALGAQVASVTPVDTNFVVLHLDAPGDRYLDLAGLDGVYSVQDSPATGGARGEMSNQSIVGAYGAAPTYTIVPGYATWLDNLGYDGSGVVASVVDGGFRTTHTDLASRVVPCVTSGATPTSCSTNNNSHGTHVAGAIAGTGATGTLLNGFRRGQGVAPGANLVQQRYNAFLGSGAGSMIANGMLTIFKESSLSNAVLTNNSWGPTSTPQGYDIPTQQVDIVARDANPDVAGNQPILNVWSIMNGNGDGSGACAPSSLGSPDEAKNLFAIGSTTLQNSAGTQQAGILNVSSNSAHGNACDGRRVPHIVAPGCYTDATGSTSDSAFAFNCGTSMASPVATGASAVFIEKYRAEHAGATPSPAMVKAAFTAAAKDLSGFNDAHGRVMGHRPDRFQGYGRIDLDAVAKPADDVLYVDQDDAFTATGATWTRTIMPSDPSRPVRIMLAWTDAKGHGLGGSTPAWVNNLDLTVTSDGATYRGNVVGGDGWSATGGSADDKNNLEGVFLSPAQLDGPITIDVLAANISADALNPYTPGTPAQDFALVCYNCSDAPLGSADLGLSLSGVPSVAAPGGAVHFVASIVNFAGDPVQDAKLTLQLPAGLSYVGNRAIAGGAWICTGTTTLECTLEGETVAPGTFARVLEIEAAVSASAMPGSTLVTHGTVSAAQFTDANAANNTDSVTTLIGDTIFENGFD
ncbi:MAG: S8 family serine peptidase, partial [Xanthomonadales bacterium]|nr:S8 family serine peptidase [Xanthomonadales bacterium]